MLQTNFPNSPAVLNLLAAQQMVEGHEEAGRALYLKAAEVAPNNLETLAALVRLDLDHGRAKDAVARIDAGLKTASPTSSFLTLAARTYGEWVGDGSEWDGDVEWPALLRRLDRLSPGYKD